MSEKVKILVVEDEFVIGQQICETLEKIGYEVLAHAFDYDEAVAILQEQQPDIALLDIDLRSSKDGIDVAKHIRANHNFPFIFLTSLSNKQTVSEAKLTRPDGYLVKSFQLQDLYTAIEIALHNFTSQKDEEEDHKEEFVIQDTLFIKKNNFFIKVKQKDILWIKSDRIYLEIQTTREKLTIRSSFKNFQTKLEPYFFRTHKSYIVNLLQIDAISTLHVVIAGEEVPIGRNYREELLKKLDKVN